MNGYERMLIEKDDQILRQRVEIDRLRIKVNRLEGAMSGAFYRITGAVSFIHLVMGELPPPPNDS